MELTVTGNIPVKKNRQRIGMYGGIYKAPEVSDYEDLVGWEARLKRCEPVHGPFQVSGTFRIRSAKDLDGVLTTVLDCLQKHGYIDNDKLMVRIRDLEKVPIGPKEVESVTIVIDPVLP